MENLKGMHTHTKWSQRFGVLAAITLVLSLSLTLFSGAASVAQAKDVNVVPSQYYSQQFLNTWLRTDYPVASETAVRSWYWGPQPDGVGVYEPYADSPGGKRLVQYFDKARMEINDASKGTVTNGLLVVEMITGKIQKGDYTFENHAAAHLPVAGDLSNPFPTYADLQKLYRQPDNTNIGDTVTQLYQSGGTFGSLNDYANDPNTNIADTENKIGIPAAFWNYLNAKGQVVQQNALANDVVGNWLFTTGYPVTQAFWTQVKVAGVMKNVMVQAFERRVLTYTPSNDPAFQVEMGNVGLAYVQWRYNGKLPTAAPVPSPAPTFTPISIQPANPLDAIFSNITAKWYSPNTVVNIRTAPNTQADLPTNTQTDPYLQRLQPGDHILVMNSVQGEEVEPGNNIWYQIYDTPNLYVYSGYLTPVTMPDFPTPPETFQGVWVTVSLDKQMMAVYDGNTQLYKTFISSGVPNFSDPTKDHSTPKGVFHIDGSWRPAVQEMIGGEGDKATGGDHYDIKDIRYVNYFFQDYSIHATYWHAKFGIAPESHGCANATLFDAHLIYQLPAGTTVEVF